jgi:Permuted papain-like amidase enzyme, YaeF/YiiX, C92 family
VKRAILDCGERCALIRSVTHSRYSHVGIVLREGDELMVWEALGPVGPTPLVEWVHRGIREELAIYRFSAPITRLADEVRAMRGLPYDGDYQWDDERIYCSELIAKAVNRALGEHAFEPKPIGPLGVYAERIRKLSGGRLTEATPIVSPLDLTRSPLVTKIVDEFSR